MNISLTHGGGSVSLDHLANLSILSLMADQVHTAKRSQRITNRRKDRFSAKPQLLSNQIAGSKNLMKAADRWSDLEDNQDRRWRKLAQKRQSVNTRTYVHQANLEGPEGFEGQWPYRAITPQTEPRAMEFLVRSVEQRNAEDPLLCNNGVRQLLMTEQERKRSIRRYVDSKDATTVEVVSRPGITLPKPKVVTHLDDEAKARRSRALTEESVDNYFGNTRRFVLANSRGI